VVLLYHFLRRLWKLHAPHTHGNLFTQHPTNWSHILLSPIYKSGKIPTLDPLHPKNYRGICHITAIAMNFQKGLLNSLSAFTADHLPASPHRAPALVAGNLSKPFMPSTLSSNSGTHLHLPTYVFFGDITLAFPSVFRQQLLLRLHDYGVPLDVWQHLRALHHTITLRVLHSHNAPDSYVNNLKGLTEGGRLCPLLWGLYVAILFTASNAPSPTSASPPPHAAFFIGILLFVDDFVLLASFALELLALMRCTQIWCAENRLELSFDKSKVMVFFEP
jgi:hypothetical protein